MELSRNQKAKRLISRRALILASGKFTLIGLLMGRLYYLQVIEADKYKTLSENNQFNIELLPPIRGRILDRNNVPLALNKDNFRIEVVLEQAKNIRETLQKLGKIIDINDANIRRVLKETNLKRGFVPVSIIDNLSREDIAEVAINTPYLPGIKIQVGRSRFYPFRGNAVHLTGYVAAVSEGEQNGDPVLELPDFRIGKSGIEKTLDKKMRGGASQQQVEVNALGRIIRKLPGAQGKAGSDVSVTIDIRLQNFLSQRLARGNSTSVPVDDPRVRAALSKGQRIPVGISPMTGVVNLDQNNIIMPPESGAAVVMDVFSGEVIALASTPGFDPNLFNDGLTARDWERLLANPRSPMINKAVTGLYSPGSTFKMVVCLAALEAGVAYETDKVPCPGYVDLGGSRFHCWKEHGHGSVNMVEAIEQSCDVYLYELAKRLGIKRIALMARRFGFGQKFDIALPGESIGLVPTPSWKKTTFGEKWHQGETLITSIGQGFILCTPLQLAVMTARLVNGGRAVKPRLLKIEEKVDMSGPLLNLDSKHLKIVLEGMNRVTNGDYGTAKKVPNKGSLFKFGGKSGSVQVKRITIDDRLSGKVKNKDRPWEERDHAMFVAYAPLQSPRYVASVVVEHGGGGSTMAAPIARDVLEQTMSLDPSRF